MGLLTTSMSGMRTAGGAQQAGPSSAGSSYAGLGDPTLTLGDNPTLVDTVAAPPRLAMGNFQQVAQVAATTQGARGAGGGLMGYWRSRGSLGYTEAQVNGADLTSQGGVASGQALTASAYGRTSEQEAQAKARVLPVDADVGAGTARAGTFDADAQFRGQQVSADAHLEGPSAAVDLSDVLEPSATLKMGEASASMKATARGERWGLTGGVEARGEGPSMKLSAAGSEVSPASGSVSAGFGLSRDRVLNDPTTSESVASLMLSSKDGVSATVNPDAVKHMYGDFQASNAALMKKSNHNASAGYKGSFAV